MTVENARERMISAGELDQPWRRIAWIIPLAVILWAGLLAAFGLLLEGTAPPPPELAPAEVRIVELPPPAKLAPIAPTQPHPVPAVVHHPAIVRPRTAHLTRPKVMPEIAPSENGTAKSKTEPRAPASSTTGPSAGAPPSNAASGVGADNNGAHAIFEPTPVIPDDLRDAVIDTVAIAHFKVADDGQASVTLTKPTENPRLNQILLETLDQWRFMPAHKNGVAVGSEFDVRIPVTVE
ncbi:MAG TPA: hypothetical protein VKS22_13645 [Candidatus Binataceae bacterium]|nr:hypothetical protein [Candidatus Binataceae bacterium]